MRCRIAGHQRAGKQGRDDSIKQFSVQPYPTYFSTFKIHVCRVELCTELFYAIIPTSFCWSAIPTSLFNIFDLLCNVL